MGNRHQEDLKRIVGIKEDTTGLGDAEFRTPVRGLRNTAYVDGSSGSISNTTQNKDTGSYSNYSNASSNYNGNSTGTRSGGGQVSGGSFQADPFLPDGYESDLTYKNTGPLSGYDINDPYTAVSQYDADYTFEQLLDQQIGPGLGENERLTTITAIDPDTGNTIELIFGDLPYNTPEGWESWNDSGAGPDPTFYEGYYYKSVLGGATGKQTLGEVVAEISAALNSGGNCATFTHYQPDPVPPPPTTGFVTTAYFDREIPCGNPPVSQGFGIQRFQCTGSDPSGPGDYCSTIPPLTGPNLTQWPVDSIISFLAGQPFVPSEWEADDDRFGFSQTGTPVLKVNFGDGGLRTGEIAQAADGSAIIYETNAGAPIGNFKKYSPDGRLVDTGSVSEIPGHLPTGD